MDQSSNINKRLNQLLSTSKNKSYAVGAITVVFIAIMTMVGILPAYSAFTFQNEENDKRDEVIAKLTTKADISKKLTEELSNKSALIDYFGTVFPDFATQSAVIDEVNTLSIANQIYLSRISFAQTNVSDLNKLLLDPAVKSQSVTLDMQGSRENILNLIKNLESSRRIFNITSVSIDKKIIDQSNLDQQNVSTQRGDFEASVQLMYFYYNKAQATPAPTQ